MSRVLLWIAVGAAGAACSEPNPTLITQLNLDRPVDVAFACYGNMKPAGDPPPPIVRTAMPVVACQEVSPKLKYDPPEMKRPDMMEVPGHVLDTTAPVPGQEGVQGKDTHEPAWYAFILQSASGTVAVATWNATPAENMVASASNPFPMQVLDADPLTPGKNAISIGEDPIAIATDKAGCFEVTANAGSCDLSELEINTALDSSTSATPVRVDRIPVKNAMGDVILARPAAMVAEPGAARTEVGKACPATATGRVYVAYPSCHLVAGVDSSSGTIVAAIQYDSAGVPTILRGATLAGVTCPDECTGRSGTVRGTITPGVRPVALDLRFDPRVSASKAAATSKLAIGADVTGAPGAAPLTIVNLDLTTSDPLSLSTQALEGNVSVTALALSPQIGMGGDAGEMSPLVTDDDKDAPGGQGQYVYAVATDGTVRVADVLTLHRECDTQIDGRFLRNASITALQCLPIGDPARPRRTGARGPGIQLPDKGVPSSVAIVQARNRPPAVLDSTPADQGGPFVASYVPPSPSVLVGYFAVVSSANGAIYIVNVDDDYAPDQFQQGDLRTSPVLVMPHQLRDNFTLRNAVAVDANNHPVCNTVDPVGGVLSGGPRLLSAAAQVIPTNTLGGDKVNELPQLLHVECDVPVMDDPRGPLRSSVSQLEFAASPVVRDQAFPDLKTVITEAWSLTWEGTLSVDNGARFVDGPQVRDGQIRVDSLGMHLTDLTRPFCEIGAEVFDIAELRGCDPANRDSDCPQGYTCYVHPKYVNPPNVSSVGACMLKSEAPRLADACRDFLTTRRRYTVGGILPGEIVLFERKHALETTPVDGCISDAQCDELAKVADAIDNSADPFFELDPAHPENPATRWTCQTDPLRAPINADPAKNKRCIQSCIINPKTQPNFQCANGTVCRPVGAMKPDDQDVPGVCLEGVEPPQACVKGPQRYDLRASEAFTVIGGTSGYVHPFIEQNGACVRDPKLGPSTVQIGRIPFTAPPCDPTADPITGQLPGGGFEPNPCSFTANQFDTVLPDAVSCTAAPGVRPPPPPPMDKPLRNDLANDFRAAPAIKFRNRAMALTIVDPYRTCTVVVPDPVTQTNTPVNSSVPFAVTGYQVEFALRGGFVGVNVPGTFALQLLGTTSPVKVLRGPTESIWVVDDGDFLSSSITQASTRGRVYRVESIDMGIANLLQ